MTKSYVQVPPQSTGKKLVTEYRKELFFDNLVGELGVGDVITGSTSGATGTISAINREGFSATAGSLYLKSFSGTFTDNEDIQVSSVTQASVAAELGTQTDYDIQKFVLSDPDNLEHSQRIDRFGASVNTFNDGTPVFGPFGTMTVGEPQLIKEYTFGYDKKAHLFQEETSGTGSVTYESAKVANLFSTGTANGDLAQLTSHYYHPYHPGVGTIIEMTCQLGDNGKSNVKRQWGLFDDDNGLFFELSGTSFSVVIRTNSTDGSTVTETRINQIDFNTDRLDGSDSIGFDIDFTKGNIFWIDYQWLGAGRVRFGVYEPSGQRIVAHVIEHANIDGLYPYMRSPNLPLRIRQENIGSVVSTTEMRFACAAVKHTAKVLPIGDKHTENSGLKTITTAGGEVPVLSIRPKLLHQGLTNRSVIKGVSITLGNLSSTNNGTVFRLRSGSSTQLTGASWSSHSGDSVSESDSSATAVSLANTHQAFSVVVTNGQSFFLQDSAPKETKTFEIYLQADGTTQPMFCVTAESLNGTSADVYVAINWEELYH
jgi:hypothetical protein